MQGIFRIHLLNLPSPFGRADLMATTRTNRALFTTWSLLERAYLHLSQSLDQLLASASISQAQVATLLDIRAAVTPLSLSQLARLRVLQSASITALVDRLQDRGLLRRVRTNRDRRVIQLELTAEGEALCAKLYPVEAKDLAEHFAALSTNEFQCLTKSLRMLESATSLRSTQPASACL
jgi:DNA-binding MarR family transcriptional regulator